MPKTEARYQVYISDPALVAEIEAYCDENNIGSDSEFGREAFRAFLSERLEN
jgi:hypothetical protein